MDTDALISHSRARFDHETAKRVLREKYQSRMIFAANGGMWRAGPELLCVLDQCSGESVVLEDLYQNPVRISVAELQSQTQQRWQEQMNAWLLEYETLRHNR